MRYIYIQIPYFILIKTAFLVWAWKYDGATQLYDIAIKPLLKKSEASIDGALAKAAKGVEKVAEKVVANIPGDDEYEEPKKDI